MPTSVPSRLAMIKKSRSETVAWLEKQGFPCTISEANHFMVDVKRPGKDFQADMATWASISVAPGRATRPGRA